MIDLISYVGSIFLFLSLVSETKESFFKYFLIKEIPFIAYAIVIGNNLLLTVSVISVVTISLEMLNFYKNKDYTKLNLFSPLLLIFINPFNPLNYFIGISLFLSFYSAKLDNLINSKLFLISSNLIWLFYGFYTEIIPIVVVNIVLLISGIFSVLKLKRSSYEVA